MKSLRLPEIDRYRSHAPQVLALYGNVGDDRAGVFFIPHPRTAVTLKVIASSGYGWDHVSVSLPNRCPNWLEMDAVKRAFFHDHETVMQLHVPSADHVNFHPYCLHLWRPLDHEVPRPPSWMVGPVPSGEAA